MLVLMPALLTVAHSIGIYKDVACLMHSYGRVVGLRSIHTKWALFLVLPYLNESMSL